MVNLPKLKMVPLEDPPPPHHTGVMKYVILKNPNNAQKIFLKKTQCYHRFAFFDPLHNGSHFTDPCYIHLGHH